MKKNLLHKSISAFFLVALICGSTLMAANGSSDVEDLIVGKIQTAGNLTVKENQVLAAVQTRAGEVFDADQADQDVKRIAAIDGVEYAYYNLEKSDKTVNVTYVVIEKNLVRSISFKGNDKINQGLLTKEIGFKKGDYLDSINVQAGVNAITELYNGKGYPFTQVSLNEELLSKGCVEYVVEEGPRTKIQSVFFVGNCSLCEKDLKKEIKSRPKKLKVLRNYFVQNTLDADVMNLLKIYQNHGFLDSKIESKVDFCNDNKAALITFTIKEGPVYQIAKVEITGNTFFTTEELYASMKLCSDCVYSEEKASYDTKQIIKKYSQTGFVDVRVVRDRTFCAPGQVALKYTITEGERFRIGRVDITGNTQTHDKVVRRVLDESNFKPGKWYNADLAKGDGSGELEKDVARTALGEAAVISALEGDAGQKNADVNITEGKTGMMMFGAGIDSSSGAIGQVVLEQRNFDITDWPTSFGEFIRGKAFRGAGQKMRLSLEPGTEVSRYSINFTEPYLNDKPVALNIGSLKYERERESYDEDRFKTYLGIERRYDDGWRLGLSGRIENVDISDIDNDAPLEIQETEGNNSLYGLKLSAKKDNTNSRFNPTNGSIFEISYEQVGGDYDFGVVESTLRWYKTLCEDLAERKTVLETKLQVGSIVGGDAPHFEKFYAGGTGSIRGFDYRGVSTRGENPLVPGDKDDPIGSDWVFLANAELAIPLSSDTFSWLVFIDSGTIDSGTYRASVGTGLQILLPQWFGPVPMRFEVAAPISKSDEDETQVFSFSVGRLF